ncbi:hypothetical protein BDQ12DRAFT_739281 [Crucibulum laeve]|uniref:Uncharacterized protein n=1 Tax=Crucibulum laeve TaxID=68775 RepID=A0A5C3LHM4_9AGAR|nr:hypothetical protein BDQ12DRAFT_739281 [Crucibulum laeve]
MIYHTVFTFLTLLLTLFALTAHALPTIQQGSLLGRSTHHTVRSVVVDTVSVAGRETPLKRRERFQRRLAPSTLETRSVPEKSARGGIASYRTRAMGSHASRNMRKLKD